MNKRIGKQILLVTFMLIEACSSHPPENNALSICKYLNLNSADKATLDISRQVETSSTQVHDAIHSKCGIHILQALIENGANPNSTNEDGETPLHIASRIEIAPKIFKLILDNGTDVNIKNKDGNTALHLIVINHYHAKATNITIETIKLLTDFGANINEKNNKGFTALHLASFYGNTDILGALISSGADIEARSSSGATAIFMASMGGHASALKKLLEHNANIETKDNENNTALHIASFSGLHSIVNFLLDKGANAVNINSDGHSPVYFAIYNGNHSVANQLISKGAQIPAKIILLKKEATAKDSYATANNHRYVAELYLRESKRDMAIDYYNIASKFFEKASIQYSTESKAVAKESSSASIKNLGILLGHAAAQTASVAAERKQANIYSRQNSQMAAMSQAKKTKTGYTGYFRAMNAYKPNIVAVGINNNPASVKFNSKADMEAAKHNFVRASKRSNRISEECTRVATCLSNEHYEGNFIKCLE